MGGYSQARYGAAGRGDVCAGVGMGVGVDVAPSKLGG